MLKNGTFSHSDEPKVAAKGTVEMQMYYEYWVSGKWLNGTDQQVDAVGPTHGYNITIVVFWLGSSFIVVVFLGSLGACPYPIWMCTCLSSAGFNHLTAILPTNQ